MHCMSFIAGVSRAFLDIDPDNPHARRDCRKNARVRKLMVSAILWADREFGVRPDENGKNGVPAVFAARLDLDETGTGDSDLFLAPIRPTSASRRGTATASRCPTARCRTARRRSSAKQLCHAFERGVPAKVGRRWP